MRLHYMRFTIAAITTMGAFAVYVSRVNLSIAIIAMVEDPHDLHNTKLPPTNTSSAPTSLDRSLGAAGNSSKMPIPMSDSPNFNQTRAPLRSIFPAIKDRVVPLITQTKFKWDQTDQGNILSAFFYGYILFQIPGARIAETVGARWILMASSVGSTLVSLTFPMATQLNSIHLLMMLRFVMGLCQSAFFPAAYVLFCRWLPERERSVLLPIMFIGSNMGSISTYIASSYLITSSFGWPSVFYVSRMVCLVVSILWCIFGSSEPNHSIFITEKERLYIEEQIDNQSSNNASLNDITLVVVKEDQHIIRYNFKQDINKNTCIAKNTGHQELKQKSDNMNNKNNYKLTTTTSQEIQTNNKEDDDLHDGYSRKNRRKIIVPEASWSKLIQSVPIWTLVLRR